jgi:hypothetical protein
LRKKKEKKLVKGKENGADISNLKSQKYLESFFDDFFGFVVRALIWMYFNNSVFITQSMISFI